MDKDIEDQLIVIEESITDLDEFARGVQNRQYDPVALAHTSQVLSDTSNMMGNPVDVERFLSQRYKG